MVALNIRLPSFDELNTGDEKQLRRLYSYLYKLDEQLRFVLNNVDEENLGVELAGLIDSKASGEDVESLIRQTQEEILLEVRKPAREVDNGGSVRINASGFYASGGEIDLRTNDGEQYLNITRDGIDASHVRSATIAPRYNGAAELHVDAAATDEQFKAGNYYRSLADACAALTGRHVDADVVILAAEGMTEYGNISLTGICGSGSVTVKGAGCVLQGALVLSQCACPVRVENLSVVCAAGDALTVRSMYAEISACTLTSASDGCAVSARNGARVRAEGCTLTAQSTAGYADETSQAVFVNCIGAGELRAAGLMIASGTVPVGGCVSAGGVMSAENVVETAADGEAPEAEQTATAVYVMTHSDSYAGGSWSWFSDADIRQGMTGGSGRIYGCIWFDAEKIRSELAGKTVQQASLRLKMLSGYGRGVAVNVQLYGTDMAYEGRTGAPTLVTSYGTIGSAEPGEVNVITIPNQVISDLAAGTVCALVLRSDDEEMYSTRSYSRNYARFAGQESGDEETAPVLTVVYN